MVVATAEVNRHTFLVSVVSVLVSLLPTLLIAAMLGQLALVAILVPIVFLFAGNFLVDTRIRRGLQLRRYEAMWDRRKARESKGRIFICHEPLQPARLTLLVPVTRLNPHFRPVEADVFSSPVASASASTPTIGVAQKRHGIADRSFLDG